MCATELAAALVFQRSMFTLRNNRNFASHVKFSRFSGVHIFSRKHDCIVHYDREKHTFFHKIDRSDP